MDELVAQTIHLSIHKSINILYYVMVGYLASWEGMS